MSNPEEKPGQNRPTLSRQRRWQIARLAAGLCVRCGSPRKHYSQRCDECQKSETNRAREKTGFRPWRQGGRGRKPKKIDEG